MSLIMRSMPDYDVSCDCTTCPEIILMAAEDDAAECDATESLWLAGRAVTNPKTSNYDKE